MTTNQTYFVVVIDNSGVDGPTVRSVFTVDSPDRAISAMADYLSDPEEGAAAVGDVVEDRWNWQMPVDDEVYVRRGHLTCYARPVEVEW